MNTTWNRKELKKNAKARITTNYWRTVLVGLIAMIVTGSVAINLGSTSATKFTGTLEEGDMAALTEKLHSIPWTAMLAAGIVLVITVLAVAIVALLIRIFLINPLEIGCDRFFQKNLTENAQMKEICFAYDKCYENSVKTIFLRDLYLALWSLLFIVPGIVKSYEYRMVTFILSEHPEMSTKQVFALSKQMMHGQKWNAFKLDLSFILWDLVGALTMGIATIFYVTPYKKMAQASLYQTLKAAA